MGATIKDIAKALGISPSTVSRALNDSPMISKETINAVKVIAKRLNYRRNDAAVGLRKSKTNCLGVIVPEIGIYFFSRIISGMQHEASEAGYQLLISQTNEDEEQEAKNIRAFANGRVDGITMAISLGTKNMEHIKEVMDEMPVVIFDRTDPTLDTVQVEADDYQGAYIATKYLIDRGMKNIGHLAGPKTMLNAKNRMNGYKQALRDANITARNNLVEHCDFDTDNVSEALKKLLKANPDLDGIFAVNDEIGVQAILDLKKSGFKVPQDISVIGFGDYPICRIVEPQLTTVSHHLYKIGQRCIQYLLKEIKGKESGEHVEHIKHEPFPSELIVRGSTR